MAAQTEITATFLGERHRWDETIVATVQLSSKEVDGSAAGAALQPPTNITIKGPAAPDELAYGHCYRFYGHWSNYKNKTTGQDERQFHFSTFVRSAPHGRAGTIRYLQEAPHIGQRTAEALWLKFGGDAVRTLREFPDVAVAAVNASHFSIELATEAAAFLAEEQALEGCTIDLIDVLTGRGFPKATAKRAVQAWGNRAAEYIRACPYRLMAFRGCGFTMTDAMYLDLGGRPDRLKRQALCVWHTLASDSEGHTWYPVSFVEAGLRKKIGGTTVAPFPAMKLAKKAKMIATRRDARGNLFLAEAGKAGAERRVAELIAAASLETEPVSLAKWEKRTETTVQTLDHARCNRCHRKLTAETVHLVDDLPYGPDCVKRIVAADGRPGDGAADVVPLDAWLAAHPEIWEEIVYSETGRHVVEFRNFWPAPSDVDGVSDHQREILDLATTGRIAILGGSPGTGKTYTAAALIRQLIIAHGPGSVAVAAPTGKAAVRVSEALAAYGLGIRAKTIHSLLRVGKAPVEGSGKGDASGWKFEHNEHNPLPYRFLIIDESSMIDTGLMASLLAARARGTHVLFVGDINQLPPVGHGAPLRDFIRAGVPCGELTEIRRNSGAIVRTCKAIRDQQPWKPSSRIDLAAEDPENLYLAGANNTDQQIAKMFAGIEAAKSDGLNPVWDVQVLVPVNAKSPLGRKALNLILQRELNKTGVKASGNPFMKGDKIVCLKNGFVPVDEERDPGAVASEDGKVFVANGELAEVIEVDTNLTVASLSNPARVVKIPRGGKGGDEGEGASGKGGKGGSGTDDNGSGNDEKSDAGCNWDLGYALSCHKSQGCEWPVVIVLLDEYPGSRRVCSREWLYTAISRAKRLCLMVGKKATADGMCRREALSRRKTFLAELIEEEKTLAAVNEAVVEA